MTLAFDWDNLGFTYEKLPYRYLARYRDGQWEEGGLTEDSTLHISESSTALHYGQQAFEGLKAYRTKDGKIQLFRPDENAKRLQRTADRLLMPRVPVEQFIAACQAVVKANHEYVPPYRKGTLYIRPLLIGVSDIIGVKPSEEYIFTVFAMPVGNYFKGGLQPTNFITSEEYDRAAPYGTGAAKVGGNYAASLLPGKKAHEAGFSDVIYLDPATHTKIEEVGAANFFAITKDNEFVTPISPSILPSITKYSLLELAEKRFGLTPVEREVYVSELDDFLEAGACGTAAVISPIGGIQHRDKLHVFHSETEVGPITHKLYDELTGIQFGDVTAPEGWVQPVDLDN